MSDGVVPIPQVPRRFYLDRKEDVTGASGTGLVAWGVWWPNGKVSIAWTGDRPSVVVWDDIIDARVTHLHGGKTKFVWMDDDIISPMGYGNDTR